MRNDAVPKGRRVRAPETFAAALGFVVALGEGAEESRHPPGRRKFAGLFDVSE